MTISEKQFQDFCDGLSITDLLQDLRDRHKFLKENWLNIERPQINFQEIAVLLDIIIERQEEEHSDYIRHVQHNSRWNDDGTPDCNYLSDAVGSRLS